MHRPFRFGVLSATAQSHSEWVTRARRAEELGYATLLMPDRPSFGGLSPLTALAVAAQATTTLRVSSYVFSNSYRHPALLAQEISTLDLLSDGRVELGLGTGIGQLDHKQLGLPFESAGTRVKRLEESLHIIKHLFTEESVSFAGTYYTITEMRGLLRSVQKPHPPILMACAGERMLSLAAREADIIALAVNRTAEGVDPADTTPEAFDRKIAVIREAAGERFPQLEIAQSEYSIALTDSQAEVISPPGFPMPKRPMSIEQAIEYLLAQRERYGYSYIQVYEGQMENFAPVVARLVGK